MRFFFERGKAFTSQDNLQWRKTNHIHPAITDDYFHWGDEKEHDTLQLNDSFYSFVPCAS